MPESEVFKKLDALTSKEVDKVLLHELQQEIDDANKAYTKHSKGREHPDIDYWQDEKSIPYSLNRKYLLGISHSEISCVVKEGTEIVYGPNSRQHRLSSVPLLELLILPNSVKVIMENSFCDCYNLKCIVFGNGLKIIERDSFLHCRGLESVILPNSLYIIDDRAFMGCSSLSLLFLPYSLQIVGEHAFDKCNQLSRIYVPRGFKDKFKRMLPEYDYLIKEIGYKTWEEEDFRRAVQRSMYHNEQIRHQYRGDIIDAYNSEQEFRKDNFLDY